MIGHLEQNLIIKDLDYLLNLDLPEVKKIREDEINGYMVYIIPNEKTPREMTIDKVGFLHEFLSVLHPNLKKYEICHIIRMRYQVFLCDKQIYRNHKYYKENI